MNKRITDILTLTVFVVIAAIFILLGISLLYGTNEIVDKTNSAVVEENSGEITCTILSVDSADKQKSNTNVGVGNVSGQSGVVVTSGGSSSVTEHFVSLEDENGMIVQFTIANDVYVAFKQKIGDTITISYSPGIFKGSVDYYWQGKRLSNPITIQEAKSASGSDIINTKEP